MATEQAIWPEPFVAEEDLSDYQYHFVVLGTTAVSYTHLTLPTSDLV